MAREHECDETAELLRRRVTTGKLRLLCDAERLQKPMYSARGKVTSTDKGGDKSVADMSVAECGKRDMLTVMASSLVRWRRRTTTSTLEKDEACTW